MFLIIHFIIVKLDEYTKFDGISTVLHYQSICNLYKITQKCNVGGHILLLTQYNYNVCVITGSQPTWSIAFHSDRENKCFLEVRQEYFLFLQSFYPFSCSWSLRGEKFSKLTPSHHTTPLLSWKIQAQAHLMSSLCVEGSWTISFLLGYTPFCLLNLMIIL